MFKNHGPTWPRGGVEDGEDGPVLKEGYSSTPSDPLVIYKCSKDVCKGTRVFSVMKMRANSRRWKKLDGEESLSGLLASSNLRGILMLFRIYINVMWNTLGPSSFWWLWRLSEVLQVQAKPLQSETAYLIVLRWQKVVVGNQVFVIQSMWMYVF